MEKESNEQISILEIPENMGYWLLRADGGKYYDDFFLNGFVAISDNEITLKKIKDCDKSSLAGITIEHYKELYNDEHPDWSNQQIAHAASRTKKFCDDIKVGDLVLVPSKRSTNFLLGIIQSNVYEITDDEVTTGERVHYAINPYLKRRKVFWLKEVSRSDISEKLYWMLSAHQTIFDLQDQKDYINQLLSPVYVQNGVCHGTIKISKKEGLNLNEWYELYSVIKEYSGSKPEEVIVKSNVQSPGLIEFIVNDPLTALTLTMVLSAPIIGEIGTKRIKLKGIIPFFLYYKRENAEIKKVEKEVELMEVEKESKVLENERAQFELERDKENWRIKKEAEALRLRQQLQISSFDPGRIVGLQTQMDNSENPDAGES